MRQKLILIADRFAGFEAQSLNVHVDFSLLRRIALTVMAGKTKIAGIKIHDSRMIRLMEVLLHAGTQLNGWRSADVYPAILTTFGLSDSTYTFNHFRYDLRKMKAHGLLERIGRGYRYRLTDKGSKAALMFVLFHKRVCGPLANSLFHHRPDEILKPASKIEAAYHKSRSRHSTGARSARGLNMLRDDFSDWPMLETDSATIPRDRRAELEAPVVAAGKHLSKRFEGWTVATPDRTRVRRADYVISRGGYFRGIRMECDCRRGDRASASGHGGLTLVGSNRNARGERRDQGSVHLSMTYWTWDGMASGGTWPRQRCAAAPLSNERVGAKP